MLELISLQTLKAHLFSNPEATVFSILDGASVPDLLENLVFFAPEHVCLYRGELQSDMAEVAPYLAILKQDSPFTDWVLTNGWGEHWGIFGAGRGSLGTLRRHFRSFLLVYDERGKSLYFRYYDPWVWRVYLPTCKENELKFVFGPVQWYWVEDENGTASRFFQSPSGLLRSTEKLP